MAVTVRRATRDDSRLIAEFALKLFAQHREYDADRFAMMGRLEGAEWFYGSQTEAEDAAVLVAESGGRVVGFAYMQYEKVNYIDLLENGLRLHDVYVDESAREMGAGTALLNAARDVAAQLGANKIVLSVAAGNEIAREFFSRNGFRTTMVELTLNLEV